MRTGSSAPGRGVESSRGVLYLTVAKAYFILTGYAIYCLLTRLLPLEQFGAYAVVTGMVAVLDAVLITGTIQAVAKFIAEDAGAAEAVRRAALRLQLMVGGGLFLAYFVSAPLITRFLRDQSLTGLVRLSSLIVISYAFYAVYIGCLNGLRSFGAQAAMDMTFSSLKLLLVAGLAAGGLRAEGAIGGFALAAFLVLVIAIAVIPRRPPDGGVPLGKIFRFQVSIVLFTLLINLILKTDLLLIKRLAPHAVSSAYAAYYAAAQALAFVPYQAVIAITFVVFPMISHLSSLEGRERVRGYIRQALRHSGMLTFLIAALFSSSAGQIVTLLFPAGYGAAGLPLSILVCGVVFFSLFVVSATVISGSGRPAHAALIALGTLAVDCALNAWLIPIYGMPGAAAATGTAMCAGMCASWVYLRSRFGSCLPFISFARIMLAALVVYGVSIFFPVTGVKLIGKLVVLSAGYGGLLLMLRELGREDYERVKRVLGITAGA